MKELRYPGSLHGHSEYSNIRLRDSIIKLPEALRYAQELGYTVIGITEHEFTGSWLKAYRLQKQYPNIKIVLGNEIYLCRNGLNADNYDSKNDRYYHFCLYAKDTQGLTQIREISTRAWQRSYMARGMRRVPTYYQDLFDIIGRNPGHVIGSTACLGGALPTQILRGTPDEKLELWIKQMDRLFGHGNFYLEMQPSNNKEQILVNKKLYEFGHKFQIPYIITTDSHYLKKEDRIIHKAYLNAQNGDREVDEFYATTYMMGTEELESYFPYFEKSDLAHAYESIEKIASMCEDYDLLKPLRIPDLVWKPVLTYYTDYEEWFKNIPMLQTFYDSEYEADRYLVNAIIDGIKLHSDLQNQRAYDEINENLEMTWVSSKVNKARWSAYYLNLQKIIDICWDAGSLVGPGRGSGVGFILLYVLGITQINPLRETTRCFAWRFLNPERVSVLDVDFDIEGGRRNEVLNAFRKFYGEDRVANVATFRTEKSKSAILTAARGLGIDVDIAQYISSLIPADRGQLRSLDQCMNGDKENDWAPIKQFVYEMTENYPELWNVAHNIEGLVCGYGMHAGGVIFVDEPFTESTALMRAPDGTICTQFDLHDCEDVSLIKYDALSVEAMDKIHNCIDLLCDYGYATREETLKKTYEKLIGIYNLERENPDMWKMVWNHEIQSLFQMEKQSGVQGIATLKPTSVDDLAILNSTIRLMAQEKGGEMPTDKLARFKADPDEWQREMDRFGLTENDRKVLEPILGMSYGLCIAQEQFMELVQLPELGGFSLTWADKLRKSIAKKNPKEYDALTKEFYDVTKEKGINQRFAHYVWDVLIAMSKGYGFNQSHTLAYSLIALQEMNLAFKYPIIFWNCACLISDSGGATVETEEEAEQKEEEKIIYDNSLDFYSVEEEEDDEEEEETKKVVKKKKQKTTNYGKIASAIGKMKSEGIEVAPPNINESTLTFSPNVKENVIRYGLSGISKVGEDIVQNILKNRPYESVEDFLNRVKVTKPQMINLIKSGAFDEFGDRVEIMRNYIDLISDKKKELNLRNVKMLIDFGLLPNELDFPKRVFNFDKYIKKFKNDKYYGINDIALNFYEENFDMDLLVASEVEGAQLMIKQTDWKKLYDKQMNYIRTYIKENQKDLLEKVNSKLFNDIWDKYCLGSLSQWEMDSVSYYSHEHELAGVDTKYYGFSDFKELDETPDIERVIMIKGKEVPIFKIRRIIGTVLDRDKLKKTVTLLTTSGVVMVKIYGDVFTHYDKQISEKGADGKKHVIEKSWLSRGNKIIVTGIRRDNDFLAKKYSRTPWHLVELITQVNENGTIKSRGVRADEVEE